MLDVLVAQRDLTAATALIFLCYLEVLSMLQRRTPACMRCTYGQWSSFAKCAQPCALNCEYLMPARASCCKPDQSVGEVGNIARLYTKLVSGTIEEPRYGLSIGVQDLEFSFNFRLYSGTSLLCNNDCWVCSFLVLSLIHI